MKVTALACNNCGAPIDVPDSTSYATCSHCGANLAIHRNATACYTEAVNKLNKAAKVLDGRVQNVLHQQRLHTLDRQWEQERRGFMMENQHGGLQAPPTRLQAILFSIALVVFCGIWTSVSVGFIEHFGMMVLVGPGIAVVGLVVIWLAHGKHQGFQQAKADYERKRHALLLEMSDH